jgi:hypothetical protein
MRVLLMAESLLVHLITSDFSYDNMEHNGTRKFCSLAFPQLNSMECWSLAFLVYMVLFVTSTYLIHNIHELFILISYIRGNSLTGAPQLVKQYPVCPIRQHSPSLLSNSNVLGSVSSNIHNIYWFCEYLPMCRIWGSHGGAYEDGCLLGCSAV